jgi:hypothetical protein
MPDIAYRTHGESDRVGSRPSPLSPQQVATYGRFGWLHARGFFARSEVEALARWTDELAALPEEPGRHMVYREPSLVAAGRQVIQRIENFCLFHAQFDAFVHAGRLREAIDELLGAPSCLFKEKINFKMPGGAGFEPHQDQQAGWSRYAKLFVTALITIDPATIANGCLEMADSVRFTGLIGDEWRPLTAKEMKIFTLVPVPTEPGDVLFFDSYAPHASKPNFTERQRRILYLTFNATADGDHHDRYFADKRTHFPPDIERVPGADYKFRV